MNFRHFTGTVRVAPAAGIAVISALTLAPVPVRMASGQTGDAPRVTDKDTVVYIGTYTGASAQGIYAFRLQSAGTEVFQNVTLVPLGLAAATVNPSYFEIDLPRRRLFTVNEVDQFDSQPGGGVTAYAIGGHGALSLVNQRASAGMRPCHLTVHPEGTHVLVANCGSGHVAVFPVGSTGLLDEPSAVVPVVTGAATDALTCATFDPGGRFVLVCDRTADRLRVYAFDSGRGTLAAAATAEVPLATGAGPRHVRFRLDGRFAYVLNERNSTITTFAYDAHRGTLTEVGSVSTLPEYFDGANVTGEIYLHGSDKWLYVSNIGHNSIVLFTVDDATGMLTFVEEQGTGGKTPRQFGIEPSSKHLAISNRDSDTVLASRIDEGNGRLKPSGVFASVPSPAGIRFLPPLEASR